MILEIGDECNLSEIAEDGNVITDFMLLAEDEIKDIKKVLKKHSIEVDKNFDAIIFLKNKKSD